MIISQTGQIADGFYVLGHPAIPVFLLDGEQPTIIDAGFSFLGHLYAREISKVLGNRHPARCLLTHSHFDHCGSVSTLAAYFPDMQVMASERARDILVRPHAISLIHELNQVARNTAQYIDAAAEDLPEFSPFGIDCIIKEGDILNVSSGRTIQVLETPGHTRDSLSYYIPEIKALLCAESCGIMDSTGHIFSECLVDYDQYLASIHKLSLLNVDIVCQAHWFVFTDQDAVDFVSRSQTSCDEFRDWVEHLLSEENGDISRVMARIKTVEYDGKTDHVQPEPAYLLNLEARIKAVGRRKGFIFQ